MSITVETRDRVCSEIINQYLFDNVWNEPQSEYRLNVHPARLKEKSVVGSFRVLDANVYLPTNIDSYFLWYVNHEDTNLGLQLDVGKWYDTATICNEFNTLIHAYTLFGKIIPKHCVYLRYNKAASCFYLAIKKDAFKLVDSIDNLDKLYLTVYFDSDIPNPVRVLSFQCTMSRQVSELQRNVSIFMNQMTDTCQLLTFTNGVESTDTKNGITVAPGNYYDIIIDQNIQFAFDIDYGKSGENPVFLSDKDKVWKQLVHIPRALNPDNKVITHNTCDFYVRDMSSENTSGRYLHRITENRTVSQVSHNDMAIPLFVIDAYRDYLKTQNIGIHVVVRIHDKDNHLIRNANYTDLLYNQQHSDEDIIKILTGHGPEKITWWKASELEKSTYTEMMFDAPDAINSLNNISKYVDALGYYQMVNLLCRRVARVTITDSYEGYLGINLPLVFLGLNVIPTVYVNGLMIHPRYFNYEIIPKTNTCKITIDPKIVLKTGDIVTTIFQLTENNSAYVFTPKKNAVTLDIHYANPLVYEIVDCETVKGALHESEVAYAKCKAGGNIYVVHDNQDGTYTVTFNTDLIGHKYIIENSNASYVKTYNLANYLTSGTTLALPIETQAANVDESIPILEYTNLSVYMNRRYLVEGIDYFVNTVRDKAGDPAVLELVIQSMDNFNETGDTEVTVYYTVAEVADESTGFSINDRLYDKTPVNLFFDNLTTVHVDGKLENNISYYGTYCQVPENKYPNGSIWEIKTAVPRVVRDFLAKYSENEDAAKITAMNEYFYTIQPHDPTTLVLENKHRIYSVFINNFIQDVLSGKVEVVNDPDLARMAKTIEPYLYLKDMDLCYREGNDQRFIDYYPQYVNYDIDPYVKSLIDTFIRTYMPKNVGPTMEVVY